MTEKRYVSFLDILGFEGIVENNELDTIIKKFESVLYFTPYWQALGQWINFKGKIKHGSAKCSCFSFSDTFVLSTDDTSIESLNNILIATFLLARNVFAVGLPVRGAITAGEADYIPNTNHLIGMGVIDAAKLERKQDWFGITLSPDILSVDDIIPSSPIGDVLVKYEVPFKNSKSIPSVVINWRLNLVIKSGTKSLFPSCSDREQIRKRDNTLRFAKYVRDNSQAYKDVKEKWQHKFYVDYTSSNESLPSDFEHGDDL